MKKLFIIISFLAILTSCNHNAEQEKQKKSIQKQLWDSNNIAYINTDVINTSLPSYPRISGSTGIIGTFHSETEQFIGMRSYIQTYHYEFYDNGYYYEYLIDSTLRKKEETGIYRIKKINNSIFLIDFFTEEKNSAKQNIPRSNYFYEVSNDYLRFFGFYNENGIDIKPEKLEPFAFE